MKVSGVPPTPLCHHPRAQRGESNTSLRGQRSIGCVRRRHVDRFSPLDDAPPRRSRRCRAVHRHRGSGKREDLDRAVCAHAVVNEAITDLIASAQTAGFDGPCLDIDFVDKVVALQRARQLASVADPVSVQVFDHSPLCTLALARYLDLPVTRGLAAEITRVVRERVYEPTVFLIRPLGFIENTAARRISYPDSRAFEAVHEAVYREHGFHLVDVDPGPVEHRVTVVEHHLTAERDGR
jgi:predicted ATPase